MEPLPMTFDSLDLELAVASAVNDAREDFAVELHSTVNIQCYALRNSLEGLKDQLASGQLNVADVQRRVDDLITATSDLYSLGRAICRRLDKKVQGGLPSVISELVANKQTLAPHIKFTLIDATNAGSSMGFKTLHALHYVVDEAITNAIKHSTAKAVDVVLESLLDGSIRVTVGDDGAGTVESLQEGFGMRMMRRRIAKVGGVFTVGKYGDEAGLFARFDFPKAVLDDIA